MKNVLVIFLFISTGGTSTNKDNDGNLISPQDLRGNRNDIVETILQKLDKFMPPKGKDFKTINGPKKHEKIGIVGAGPAGIHMAYLLKE